MERAFKTQNGLLDEAEIYLMFDGERLDSQSLVSDTELSDMDHVDVHVK